jgi:hypothetical protein
MSMPSEFESPARCPSPKNFPSDDQLPKAFAEYYLAYARPLSIASDPFHLMAMLSCVSAVIGPRCYVRYGHLCIYPSISSLLLGVSTLTGKSEALNIAKQLCLDQIEGAMRREFDAHQKAYENAMAEWKKLPKDTKSETAEPEPPERSYLRCPEDFTNAALAQVLETQDPGSHGCVVLLDEFSALLIGRTGQFNTGLTQLLTKIHSCESIFMKRAGGGDTYIELPFLCIAGCSTPEWLLENMQQSDVTGGWLIRYLIYEQKEKPDRAPPSMRPYPNRGLAEKWQSLIAEIHTSTSIQGEWRLSKEALVTYDKAYHKVWDTILLPEEDKGDSMAGRALNMIFRVALVFEILNTRGNPKREGNVGEKFPVIQQDSMEQAIRVVFFYLKGMIAMRKTTLTGGNPAIQEKLVQRLRQGEMSKTEVYQFCTSHKRGIRSADIQEIYTSLEEQQIITVYDINTPKKKPLGMVRLWEAGDDDLT